MLERVTKVAPMLQRKKVRQPFPVYFWQCESQGADLAPPDPRQFAEEVDITPKLPANLYTNLTSSKWKERKEVLDDLLTLLNATPRIKEAAEFGELSKALALRVQSDANINCVTVAAQCLEGLAKGLMGSFGRYREIVVPPMLERLKERKASVTDLIGVALDAIFETVSEVVHPQVPSFLSAVADHTCRHPWQYTARFLQQEPSSKGGCLQIPYTLPVNVEAGNPSSADQTYFRGDCCSP
jgi:hypothetical protein